MTKQKLVSKAFDAGWRAFAKALHASTEDMWAPDVTTDPNYKKRAKQKCVATLTKQANAGTCKGRQ